LLTSAAQNFRYVVHFSRDDGLYVFRQITPAEEPRTPEELPLHLLVGSFVLSELKTAFQMGFVIFLPFLVIDRKSVV